VFTTNPYPDVVNGSLWTLPVEFSCYLAVPFLCVLPVRLRLPAAIAASVAAMAAFYRLPSQLSVIGTPVQLWFMLVSFFAAGAALRSVAMLVGHQRWLRLDVALLLIVGETFMPPVRPSWTTGITLLVLPYLVMSFSLASTPVLRRASRFGDFSYGVYLWAFPVQQFVIMKRVYPPMWVDLPLVAAITIPIAVVSWRLVEKPALSLKRAGTRPAHRATREMSYAKSAGITNG
jgi:peptidoglycan/LPS O-acetylase OafA/YrhL